VESFCEYDKEHLGSIKCQGILELQDKWRPLEKDSAPRSYFRWCKAIKRISKEIRHMDLAVIDRFYKN
jgi:hypothetical protein